MNNRLLKRTTNTDKDFVALVDKLNVELAVIDGDDHAFYNQYNGLDEIKHVIIAYADKQAVACGAIKAFDSDTMEVKRMYTEESVRGQGFATQVLEALEKWAIDLGQKNVVLETGKRQEDAVALYSKNGYNIIPNFGQYIGVENSCCFKKEL